MFLGDLVKYKGHIYRVTSTYNDGTIDICPVWDIEPIENVSKREVEAGVKEKDLYVL